MGLVECRSGRLVEGIPWLRQAVDADPQNIAFRVMLVRALVDAGRPAEGLETAIPPSGSSPSELALWHARAEAADASGEREASVEAWGRLCSAGAGDWRVWNNYANTCAALGRWTRASAAFRRALELNPSEVPLRRSLAMALAREGRFEESADELGRWVEASSDNIA